MSGTDPNSNGSDDIDDNQGDNIHQAPEATPQHPTNEYSLFSAAKIKAPEFFTSDPELWFYLLESQFNVHRVASDNMKFHVVISQLSQSVANSVKEVIKNQPLSGKYNTIKTRLIREFSPSEQGKIKKLLSEMELGDRKPTFLLQEMRGLAGTTVDDTFLQTLWLDRLPSTLQQILSPWNDQALDKLAQMADRIVETTNLAPLPSTNLSVHASRIPSKHYHSNSSEKSPFEKINEQLSKLITRVERLESKNRDKTPARKPNEDNREKKHDMCWFHYKFGKDATQCRLPCNFKTSENK